MHVEAGSIAVKISLTERGGQAGAMRKDRPARVLDAGSLPPDAAAKLAELVAAAKTEPTATAQAAEAPGRARDQMSYKIEIQDGEEPTVLRGSDVGMSPAFDSLLTYVQRQLRAK